MPQTLPERPKLTVVGESYAAGVGIGVGNDSYCKRHSDSYGPVLAMQFNYELDLLACTGAKVTEVLGDQLPPPGTDRADQLSLLDSDSDVVTASMGGNDIKIDTLFVCFGIADDPQTCIDDFNPTITDLINALDHDENGGPGLLYRLYTEILNRAPNAEIYVIGYPAIFDADGDFCDVARGDDLTVQFGSHITDYVDDLMFILSATVEAVVNDVNRDRGTDIRFVPTAEAFARGGGGLCQADGLINGIVFDDGNPIPDASSFHPNRGGYQTLADVIESAIN